MSTPELLVRPKRADARRNYDQLIAAAREAFREKDRSASLEDIARRAGVGIGTLYRHFPTRTDLIQAVYVEEVEALARSADDVAGLEPWDALIKWLHGFVGYIATKQALADELFAIADHNVEVFANCRAALNTAGEPLHQAAHLHAVGNVGADDHRICIANVAAPVAELLRRSVIFEAAVIGIGDVAVVAVPRHVAFEEKHLVPARGECFQQRSEGRRMAISPRG